MSRFNRTILLEAALSVAKAQHFSQVTRETIASEAGCSPGLVSKYLGTMAQARDAILDLARRRGVLRQVQQAPFDNRRNSGRNGPVKS